MFLVTSLLKCGKILTVCVLEAIAATAVVIVLSCDNNVANGDAAVAVAVELHKLSYEKDDCFTVSLVTVKYIYSYIRTFISELLCSEQWCWR